MKRFSFRLQRLLHLKADAEQRQVKKLADAIRHADDVQARVNESDTRRAIAEDQIGRLRQESTPAGMLTAAEAALRAVRGKSNEDLRTLGVAKSKVVNEQGSLDTARRERKSLERLREKQYASWAYDVNRREQEQIDEVAARMKRAEREENS